MHQRISIHAPRTGSDNIILLCSPLITISIHAPRTGSDPPEGFCYRPRHISIHAPRTGSDPNAFRTLRMQSYFNPRSPHGERQRRTICNYVVCGYFNPRSPHGERHLHIEALRILQLFQSTLPARGATAHGNIGVTTTQNFNPRSPHGERLHPHAVRCSPPTNFNPRSPHGERHA